MKHILFVGEKGEEDCKRTLKAYDEELLTNKWAECFLENEIFRKSFKKEF
jgi:hypothetical protein